MNEITLSTAKAAKIARLSNPWLSYRQVDYWINQGVIKPSAEYGQGKAREFSFRDMVKLHLAADLRKDKYSLEEIRQAMELIDKNWKNDNPDDAGVLIITRTNEMHWVRKDNPIFDTDQLDADMLQFIHANFRKLYSVINLAGYVEGVLHEKKAG